MRRPINWCSFFSEIKKPPFLSPRPSPLVKGDDISAFKTRNFFFHSSDIVSVISCVLFAWMLSLLGDVKFGIVPAEKAKSLISVALVQKPDIANAIKILSRYK